MTDAIERHFVTLAGEWGPRQVHYRRAGSGPPLVLLHQSPQSSREYEPLMREWSRRFTVIAPDTPGYGQSDPLPVGSASMQDLARSVAEFTDALGLDRFGLYGFHTGGGMAVAVADAFPDKVNAAVACGLVVPTSDELERILAGYLPAFAPAWDGSHLAWLWARLREQTVFFPWFQRSLDCRMDYDMPPPDRLQAGVREFLQAGDHYRVAYRAAFEYDALPALARMRPPCLITAAQLDPLAPHLDRIGPVSKSVETVVSADAAEATDRAFRLLSEHAGGNAPPPPAAQPLDGRAIWQDGLQLDGIGLRTRRSGPRFDALVFHAAGGSAETADGTTIALGNAIAVDLPGHGEHTRNSVTALSIKECAEFGRAALQALGGAPVVLAGDRAGALVAVELARSNPELCRALVLKDLPLHQAAQKTAILDRGLPSLSPDWHGGHLSRAWHMVRDGRLFYPWFERQRPGIRWSEPDLDIDRLMLEVREYLSADGCWQDLVRDALDYSLADELEAVDVPVCIALSDDNPARKPVAEFAAGIPGSTVTMLPVERNQWAGILASFVAG